MTYDKKRVAARLKELWEKEGQGSPWLDLPCQECGERTCSCRAASNPTPKRRPQGLDDCVERLRVHALAERLGGDVPAFLRSAGSPARPRPRRAKQLPVGVRLAALGVTIRETPMVD